MPNTINDFQKGDSVYHLSNHSLSMVAIEINTDLHEITCRWVDKSGKTQSERFIPEELGKSSDLSIGMFSF